MASDPLRPLRRGPVHLTVGGVSCTFPHTPVRAWIELGAVRTAAVRFADQGRMDLLRGIAAGAIDGTAASHELVEVLTGRKWWEAETLLVTSGNPDVLGALVLARVDPDAVSLGEWCAAVWRILTKDLDEKGRSKLEMELSLPPVGYEDAWEDDEAYYNAMQAQASRFGA